MLGKFKDFLKSPSFKLYLSYGFSSWGDRMWLFAAGLALAQVGNNLQLPAVSGFVDDAAVFLLGSVVGSWIDRVRRFRAAATSLTVTNFSIAAAAGILAAMLHWKPEISAMPPLYYTLMVLAILITALSKLSNAGTKISLTKDWVIVIAGGDYNVLASLNAMLLRINLTSMIISPLIAGQIMTSVNMAAGCLFIAGWNLVCFGIEYYCLYSIYKAVPELSKKVVVAVDGKVVPGRENADKEPSEIDPLTGNFADSNSAALYTADNPGSVSSLNQDTAGDGEKTVMTSDSSNDQIGTDRAPEKRNCLGSFGSTIMETIRAWSLYRKQECFTSGLALGLLYMTVLGWDSITTSYALFQGLPENVLSAITAAAAVLGICGSFFYPYMRRWVGLSRTGLIALFAQVTCLSLCVISIWLPGSPFDPVGFFRGAYSEDAVGTAAGGNNSAQFYDTSNNYSSAATAVPGGFGNGTVAAPLVAPDGNKATLSIVIFLLGICLARFGLWIADLSIAQIFQETVEEHQRGIVNGVQNSFNMSMDMLKNLLVIILPSMETFGLLIIASFSFVCGGWMCMAIYNYKVRGHLFHFEKLAKPFSSTAGCLSTKRRVVTDKRDQVMSEEVDSMIGVTV